MIQKASRLLSKALAGRGIFEPEDAEVYAYGFELMISTAVNVIFVMIVSIIFSMPFAWAFFLLPFVPLRMTAGGYHAKTHLVCITVFTVAYTLLLLTNVYLSRYMTPAVLLAVSAVNMLLVLLLAPLPATEKPLDDETRAANRKRSLLLAAGALVVTAAAFFAGDGLLRLFQYFTLGQAGAALSLVAAKIIHQGENAAEDTEGGDS